MTTETLEIKDLKEGDIILCPPNDLIGKVIVKLTGGTMSHSAIYCGLMEKKPIIAHAHKNGIMYNTLEELFTVYQETECYVRRRRFSNFKSDTVICTADKYIQEGNPYAYENLITLSLLAVFSRMSTKIIKSQAYYDLLEMLALKLMKELNDLLYKDKHPMTCSQFVAQCYTNENDYIIQFKELIVDTVIRQFSDKMTSLIEIVRQGGAVNSQSIGRSNTSDKSDEDIVKNFLELLERAEKEDLPESDVSDEDLTEIGAKLITTLSEIHCMPKISAKSPFSKANDMKPEDRNFFVTPDDLNTNAIDFEDVGRLTEAVFSK